MVLDHIDNISQYGLIDGRVKAGLTLAEELAGKKITAGKYKVDGDNLYYLVSDGLCQSEENASWEAHEKYTDIHLILEGSEWFSYSPRESLLPVSEDKAIDKIFLSGEGFPFLLKKGMFVICDTQDAHKANYYREEKLVCNRVCIKIKKENN